MAQAPQHQPAKPANHDPKHEDKPLVATKQADAPPPVETIAEEQRRRSAEMEAMGVEAYMAQFDNSEDAVKKKVDAKSK